MTMSHLHSRDKTLKQTSFSVTHRAGSLHEVDKEDKRPHMNTEFSVDWEHNFAMGGHANVDADNSDVTIKERFNFYTNNKPVIIRCPNGFLTYGNGTRLEVSRDQFDDFVMVPAPHGGTYLRAGNNRFVELDEHGNVNVSGYQPTELRLSVRGNQRISLQSPGGRYLRDAGGHIAADGVHPDDATLFEIAHDRHVQD